MINYFDGDNKNRKVIGREGNEILIYKDPNHAKLSFERYLTKSLDDSKQMVPGVKDCFYGPREKK